MNLPMIRVRFAPSPTGDLHVGGLRTALYNYLFTRKMSGKFVLRIEDTDRERHVPEAVSSILHTLTLCNIKPDEGPGIGGDFGPYVQSERLNHYREAAERLILKGFAYPCFCTQERLDALRAEHRVSGEISGYDRKCRGIDPSLAAQRMEAEPTVIRLKVPTGGEIIHNDLVWGEVVFPFADVDDQILVKSDGYPTYHLANVVDDSLMKISHVIRGEEWLPSVPKHLLLYQYLGVTTPEFAHLPLILNQDRQKLSKREGSGSVGGWLNQGILPEALINYIALLGWRTDDDREIFSLSELIEAFTLECVNRSGAVFDPTKLVWLSGEHLKKSDPVFLVEKARPYLKNTEFFNLSDTALQFLLSAVRDRIQKFDELPEKLAHFSSKPPAPDNEAQSWLSSESAGQVLPLIFKLWKQETDADADTLLSFVKQAGKETSVKGKNLWMPLRAVLTGRTAGPELRVLITYLGAHEVIKRLERYSNNGHSS